MILSRQYYLDSSPSGCDDWEIDLDAAWDTPEEAFAALAAKLQNPDPPEPGFKGWDYRIIEIISRTVRRKATS